MSTALLERHSALDPPSYRCPTPQCACPAQIEDCWTHESTDGPIGMVKLRCSAGCWYTVLAEDLSPAGSARPAIGSGSDRHSARSVSQRAGMGT